MKKLFHNNQQMRAGRRTTSSRKDCLWYATTISL